MISFLLGLIITILRLVGFLLLAYCVATVIVPDNAFVKKAAAYVEPVLAPFRALIERYIPKLASLKVDLSPVAVWLVISVIAWVLSLIQRLFS